MKYYLFARNINYGDPVYKVFDTLEFLETYILGTSNEIEEVRIILGEEKNFMIKVDWKD